MKITHLKNCYGEIVTVLPAAQKRRQLWQLSAAELAQLLIDLRTIPQPQLRPMERENLTALIASYGQRQFGARQFGHVVAAQFGRAMLDVRRFDDTCQRTEAKMSLANGRNLLYTPRVASSNV